MYLHACARARRAPLKYKRCQHKSWCKGVRTYTGNTHVTIQDPRHTRSQHHREVRIQFAACKPWHLSHTEGNLYHEVPQYRYLSTGLYSKTGTYWRKQAWRLIVRCAPGVRLMQWFECRKLNSDCGRLLRTSASRILAIYMRVSGAWSHTNPSKTAFGLYLVVGLYCLNTSTSTLSTAHKYTLEYCFPSFVEARFAIWFATKLAIWYFWRVCVHTSSLTVTL
jgi:hypothetical protein